MSTLELHDIRKSFGALEMLKGIDLSLETGEFLVLLGASGCGKSTLLSIISGLSEPSSGEVVLDGRTLNGVHPKNRDIAMVFQSYALYPNLTVARNIGFGLEMRNVDKATREEAVRKAAKMLQIEALLDRKPADLSGGQRQRVAIGRAMVREPKLFLFDEPLSNLDAKLRMEMRSELKRLHQMLGVTIVYVTHDQIEAMTLATRIAVMNGGRIEQIGTPAEIYNRPNSRFVAEFMGAPPMNMLPATACAQGLQFGSTQTVWPCRAPDTRVTVGIRPEALKTTEITGGLSLTGRVDLIELTGPEQIVSLDLGENKLTATLPAEETLSLGQSLTVYVDPARLSVFDAETGLRVEVASEVERS
ncbi:sn-glycerol-3-phosphate ABC transporter ATP-binding protein UgpC [Thioclava sp. IC9]|uniref:ABC transporter ATP-binding protein n=1 Tax=Thioclava sp. IC9 TaxID=1973007 RepID=UPI000B5484A3|nr:sn-glycerol-3-phosphate ABC transporter ATP-binding protein UgpC [Thioclava sp. IC9]OWX98631.1 sugar ABC transporter ATP-binding protein [Thioclava sp. IC9]